jgi:two-component system cell cycle sensor histidine kinase/response regulator CckA
MAEGLPAIEASAIQIHQVLLNLCLNARDAMPRGGTLRIEADACALSPGQAAAIPGGRPGSYVLLRVTDDGSGIAPEVLAQIWRPFFTTKATGKGAGLGLSTVRGIMESHAGFSEVQTALGRGSSFRLYLPIATVPAASPAPAPAAPLRRGNGELILIVDDEEGVRELAAALLSRAGYRVLAAGDGAEALSLFSQRGAEISLVISDTRMPVLNGRQLAQALRRMESKVPIVEMSGLSRGDTPDSEVSFEEYAAGFLRKPFKPDTLLAAVQEAIPSSRESAAARPGGISEHAVGRRRN